MRPGITTEAFHPQVCENWLGDLKHPRCWTRHRRRPKGNVRPGAFGHVFSHCFLDPGIIETGSFQKRGRPHDFGVPTGFLAVAQLHTDDSF